jgi:ABC-type bacteriocin/lantibiotic exporter with double-glycine peptidase domain
MRLSAGDQIWLCLLSLGVAFLDTVPLELQRRIVNRAIKEGNLRAIMMLALFYALVVLVQGLLKYASNMYRAWVSEHAVRTLRSHINAIENRHAGEAEQGVKVSMVLAESEPIGSFVGDSVSEPVLHAGILLGVTGYLIYLQPLIALVLAGVFVPQFIYIPLIQRIINKRAKTRISVLRQASAGVIQDETSVESQDARFERVFRINISVNGLKYGLNFLMNLSHHLGTAAILAVGGFLVLSGKTQVGTIVAFISGLSTVKDPWGDLVNWYQNLMVTDAKFRLLASTLNEGARAKPRL